MLAFNKRLNHKTKIKSLDFSKQKAMLLLPDTRPEFVYEEHLSNIDILESTKVFLDEVEIFEGDYVTNGTHTFKVEKVPGGYFPFIDPVRENFIKVDDEQ